MWTTSWARRLSLAVLAGADVGTLVGLRPHAALVHDLAGPHRWVAAVGPDAAAAEVAGAALWLVAGWLAVGLSASAASVLPGVAGRGAARLARCTLPRAVYRLAAGAVGLGVLCSPAASVLASAAPPSQHETRATADRPAPAWPTDDPVPAPRWPTSTPSPSTSRPGPSRPEPNHDAPAGRAATAVVVAAGDSLWRVAAAHLSGPDPSAHRVAAAWPRWYATNRAVIGADPNHLTPGQVLAVPAPSPAQEDPS
jgi:nucleoid-associated protein YgaU